MFHIDGTFDASKEQKNINSITENTQEG